MTGGEKRAFFASENPGFPERKTAVFRHGLLQQTAHLPRNLRGAADAGMHIFGKMKGKAA